MRRDLKDSTFSVDPSELRTKNTSREAALLFRERVRENTKEPESYEEIVQQEPTKFTSRKLAKPRRNTPDLASNLRRRKRSVAWHW